MDTVLINHDLLVTVAISVTGALFAALGTLSYYLMTMIIRKIEIKIETCNEKLNSQILALNNAQIDAKKKIDFAHNRITDHVEKHHTN